MSSRTRGTRVSGGSSGSKRTKRSMRVRTKGLREMNTFDVEAVRRDFPILERTFDGKPLVYLDSGATSQKPAQVIEAESAFYRLHNANAHRGIYTLGQEATAA